MTPEELITLRMVAFGIGWFDEDDERSLRSPRVDEAPQLEVWRRRDPGAETNHPKEPT